MRKLMAKGGVIVANGVLGCEVDERSVFGVGKTGLVIARLARTDTVLNLQVPIRNKIEKTSWNPMT